MERSQMIIISSDIENWLEKNTYKLNDDLDRR